MLREGMSLEGVAEAVDQNLSRLLPETWIVYRAVLKADHGANNTAEWWHNKFQN